MGFLDMEWWCNTWQCKTMCKSWVKLVVLQLKGPAWIKPQTTLNDSDKAFIIRHVISILLMAPYSFAHCYGPDQLWTSFTLTVRCDRDSLCWPINKGIEWNTLVHHLVYSVENRCCIETYFLAISCDLFLIFVQTTFCSWVGFCIAYEVHKVYTRFCSMTLCLSQFLTSMYLRDDRLKEK